MDNTKIEAFFASTDALATPEAKITALKGGITDQLAAYQKLEDESAAEIERLSKELSFATSTAGKTTLSVIVNDQRYTTPSGRKYNIAGMDLTIEDIVKDDTIVARLIGVKSGIFTLSEE
jgi:hypothetical protein